MRYVRVEGGKVINATTFDGEMPKGWDAPNVWLASDEAQIGWAYSGKKFVAPPPPDLPPATVADVKIEAGRRIEAVMPMWMVAREVSGGDPIPDDVKAMAAAIRERSGEIEAMDPVPRDFHKDAYWPEV